MLTTTEAHRCKLTNTTALVKIVIGKRTGQRPCNPNCGLVMFLVKIMPQFRKDEGKFQGISVNSTNIACFIVLSFHACNKYPHPSCAYVLRRQGGFRRLDKQTVVYDTAWVCIHDTIHSQMNAVLLGVSANNYF